MTQAPPALSTLQSTCIQALSSLLPYADQRWRADGLNPDAELRYKAALRFTLHTLCALFATSRGLLPQQPDLWTLIHQTPASDTLSLTRLWESLRLVLHELDQHPLPSNHPQRQLHQALTRENPLPLADLQRWLQRLLQGWDPKHLATTDPLRLGRLYELMLGWHLAPSQEEANPQENWGLRQWKGTRKDSGTFYTPPRLAKLTVRRALPPIDEVLSVEQILALRICDPAMGAGVFLHEALAHLTLSLRQKLQNTPTEQLPSSFHLRDEAKTPPRLESIILRHCLYGVDIDPDAVEFARLGLWLRAKDPTLSLSELAHFLRCGDALVGCWKTQLTHPPHKAWQRDTSSNARQLSKIQPAPSSTTPPPDQKHMDLWCAMWFWPPQYQALAPKIKDFFLQATTATLKISQDLSQRHRFFHWELAFPEVFERDRPGFDMILGNPPWETLQPSSKEFFSRYDPAYRSYGKQRALERQKELFQQDPAIQEAWEAHNQRYRDLTHWLRHAGCYGQTSDATPPFRYQGKGKAYTYKLFLELAYHLTRQGGRFALIVPASLTNDHGATALRRLFLERCDWQWIFSFENRDLLFADVDSRFKFCCILLQKGGSTSSLQTAFMRRDIEEWGRAEEVALDYPLQLLQRVSPHSASLLELQDTRDLRLLQKLIARCEPLYQEDTRGEGLRYQQGDFNMTADTRHFLSRARWQEQGYRTCLFGAALRGPWQSFTASSTEEAPSDPDAWILHQDIPDDAVLSEDGNSRVALDALKGEDIALPLFQGVMLYDLGQNAAAYQKGAGHRSRWTRQDPRAPLRPQFRLLQSFYRRSNKALQQPKMVFRALSNATNERTWIGACVWDQPCGNSVGLHTWPALSWPGPPLLSKLGLMSSLTYDWLIRKRLTGTNLNRFLLAETFLPVLDEDIAQCLAHLVARICFAGYRHSRFWQAWAAFDPTSRKRSLVQDFALTHYERLRLRCILDAASASLFGLDQEDLRWIARDCDHPVAQITQRSFARTLDPKGFWRIDKGLPPVMRYPTLVQATFAALQNRGLRDFLRELDDWDLPEALCLRDLGLGHDASAKEVVPLHEAWGPRLRPWQQDADIETTWRRCDTLAEIQTRLREID